MKTGDLVLYTKSKRPTRWWLFDMAIDMFTWSDWVHVGIILVDPIWLGLAGIYILESAWTGLDDSVDHIKKFGVQVVPFAERMIEGSTYLRSYEGREFEDDELIDAYEFVKDKPYDISPEDWIKAFVGYDPNPQRVKSFWCSALAACIFTKLQVLEEDTDWSIISPKFFGDKSLKNFGKIVRIY